MNTPLKTIARNAEEKNKISRTSPFIMKPKIQSYSDDPRIDFKLLSRFDGGPRFATDRFIAVYNSHDIELSRHAPERPNLCLTLSATQLKILLGKLPEDFEIYAEEVKCSNHEYYLALKVRY